MARARKLVASSSQLGRQKKPASAPAAHSSGAAQLPRPSPGSHASPSCVGQKAWGCPEAQVLFSWGQPCSTSPGHAAGSQDAAHTHGVGGTCGAPPGHASQGWHSGARAAATGASPANVASRSAATWTALMVSL